MPSQPNPPHSETTHMRMNDHMLGSIFDEKYRILSFIDKGGMGTIYKALQLSLNREVAIKLMQCPDDPIAEKRFFLEASHCAQLKHPNTIRILGRGAFNFKFSVIFEKDFSFIYLSIVDRHTFNVSACLGFYFK